MQGLEINSSFADTSLSSWRAQFMVAKQRQTPQESKRLWKGESGALALSTCFYTSKVRSIRQGPYVVFTAPLLPEHGISVEVDFTDNNRSFETPCKRHQRKSTTGSRRL